MTASPVIAPAHSTPTTVTSSSGLTSVEQGTLKHTTCTFRSLLAMGITVIVLGVIGFSFGVASIFFGPGMYYTGYGIWCGVFFITTGSFNIAAAKRPDRCTVVASLTLSIICIHFAVIQLSLASVAISVDNGYSRQCWHSYYPKSLCLSANSIILFCAVATGVLNILTAVFSAQVHCCCNCSSSPSDTAAVQYVMTAPGGDGQVTVLPVVTRQQYRPGGANIVMVMNPAQPQVQFVSGTNNIQVPIGNPAAGINNGGYETEENTRNMAAEPIKPPAYQEQP